MLMLLFKVGDDLYAIDTEPIIEIFPKIQIKKIPHTPDYVLGTINYAGTPIPIIDLGMLIQNKLSNNALFTRIILIEQEREHSSSIRLGLVAEKVTEMVEIDSSSFKESGLSLANYNFLDGVYIQGEVSIQQIILDKLIHSLQGVILE